jgi:hypothetical protein
MADEGEEVEGIMDISETPDVAVWVKRIREGIDIPSDTVKQSSKISSMTLHAKKRSAKDNTTEEEKEKKSGEVIADPANKEDIAKAIGEHMCLTDEA